VRQWRFPADTALGLEETGGLSRAVQEMAALLASKMPVSEASAGAGTFDRGEAAAGDFGSGSAPAGERAQKLRRQADEQARGASRKPVQAELVLEPIK